jgi:hypothetical protein
MEVEEVFWPSIEAQFDSLHHQSRALTNRGLRSVTLSYRNITKQQRDVIQVFFNKRKGKGERFDYKYHYETLTDPSFESGDLTNIWSPDDANVTISSTPGDSRSGLRCAKITVPGTPAEKRLTGIQKFPVFPGDQVYVSGYAKASSGTGAIGTIFIELFDLDDIYVAAVGTADITLTTNYALYNASVFPSVVPANVVSGAVKVRCTAASTAGRVLFFDDVSVKIQFGVKFLQERLRWEYHESTQLFSGSVEMFEVP